MSEHAAVEFLVVGRVHIGDMFQRAHCREYIQSESVFRMLAVMSLTRRFLMH